MYLVHPPPLYISVAYIWPKVPALEELRRKLCRGKRTTPTVRGSAGGGGGAGGGAGGVGRVVCSGVGVEDGVVCSGASGEDELQSGCRLEGCRVDDLRPGEVRRFHVCIHIYICARVCVLLLLLLLLL